MPKKPKKMIRLDRESNATLHEGLLAQPPSIRLLDIDSRTSVRPSLRLEIITLHPKPT